MPSNIRQEIMDWVSFGLYIFTELIPGGAAAFQVLLALFPKEVVAEITPEMQAAKVAEWKAQRDVNDDMRNLRRTDEQEPPVPE